MFVIEVETGLIVAVGWTRNVHKCNSYHTEDGDRNSCYSSNSCGLTPLKLRGTVYK